MAKTLKPHKIGDKYYWYDVEVYGGHLPNTGNVPRAVLRSLPSWKGGGFQSYGSEEEAHRELAEAQKNPKPEVT